MKQQELEEVCRAVGSGEERFVENIQTRHAGRVISCSADSIEIDIYGKQEMWKVEDCNEIRPEFFDRSKSPH